MFTTKRRGACCALVGMLIVALVVFAAACGDSAETSTTAAAPTTAAPTTAAPTTTAAPPTTSGDTSSTGAEFSGDEAVIAANFARFFDGSVAVEEKPGLLENGEEFLEELEDQAASPMSQAASVSVSSVTITSPEVAEVGYTIMLSGVPALADQMGKAVLQDGVWKVSAETFQALLVLQGGASSQ